jgi:oligopeptide/dipeptide ABC transporter ATP-binding protein
MSPLLQVDRLRIAFPDPRGSERVVVDGVSFTIERGELVALVGESGCGKSLTGLALPALLPHAARMPVGSSIRFDDTELVGLPEPQLRTYRGARMAMVFQDPMASLNPVMRIGDQVIEAVRAHRTVADAAARAQAVDLLREVGIADPAARVESWPHQLSGGMRQRVMLAIALAGEPELLIADEPTTALDVTVQAQILELLDRLRATRQMAVLLITHDLGIVAGRAERVLVMYGGRIVESAPTAALFAEPQHPYTRGLLGSLPRLDAGSARLVPIPGTVPSPDRWPTGCRFHPRCAAAVDRCSRDTPPLDLIGATRSVACWVAHAGEPT